ncbi:MAG TPA: c-type cytochrome domain-containing protein, partial [Bryobacteraceae bacterium]|nr:c-type cytochrome domain-containing protein [Bryobacteraceae bacterium]
MVALVLLYGAATAQATPAETASTLSLAVAPGHSGIFQWRPFLAPFHSVVLHFPIGFVVIAFLLELYSIARPSRDLRKAITFVLMASLVSAAAASALGLMRAGSNDYDAKTLELHKRAGLAVAFLTAAALGFQWLAVRNETKRYFKWCYQATLLTTIGALVYAGHQGGNLTHGSNYLVKNAPYFVKTMLEDEPEEESNPAVVTNEKDQFFIEKIQPIFEKKCGECHGAEKQKSGYRLDEKEVALKGGQSGETAIKPGDPLHSNLVRLILLPQTDDDAMPPEGKAMLTPEEIVNLIRWIEAGANFPSKSGPGVKEANASVNHAEAPGSPPPAGAASAVTAAPKTVPKPMATVAEVEIADHALSAAKPVDFVRDIKPILERHCLVCHGSEKQRRGLRLDTLAGALAGGKEDGP